MNGETFDVQFRRFPKRAPLTLKTKRRQRAVVSAAARDAGAEQIAMGQQVRRHERAITVTANADALRISDAHLRRFVDRGFRAHHDLFDVSVVNCFRMPTTGIVALSSTA